MIKYQKGSIVKGVVSGITNYGIFVKIDDTHNGLIHISEISSKYVRNPNEYARMNEVIRAEVLDVDSNTDHIRLSIKNIRYKDGGHHRKMVIKETSHGFETLASNLPIWIKEGLNCKKSN